MKHLKLPLALAAVALIAAGCGRSDNDDAARRRHRRAGRHGGPTTTTAAPSDHRGAGHLEAAAPPWRPRSATATSASSSSAPTG